MTVEFRRVSEITEKCVAIVRFGPRHDAEGTRAGEYYQVTIDPTLFSHSGEMIRFGLNQGDEITGWQKADSIAVVDILGLYEGKKPPLITTYNNPLLDPKD
jgi:hypothetical protein